MKAAAPSAGGRDRVFVAWSADAGRGCEPGNAGTSDYEVQMTVHLDFAQATWGNVYSVLARATPDASVGGGGTFYAFRMMNAWSYPVGGCSATFSIVKAISGSFTQLAAFPYPCHDGMTMGMVVRGSAITVAIDSAYTYTLTDSSITSGKAGVSFAPMTGTGITNVKIGAIDTTAPGPVSVSSILSSAFKPKFQP